MYYIKTCQNKRRRTKVVRIKFIGLKVVCTRVISTEVTVPSFWAIVIKPFLSFTDFHTKLECYYTWLEKIAREKHSSLLWKFVNYGRKKFYYIGPGSRAVSPRSIHFKPIDQLRSTRDLGVVKTGSWNIHKCII